MLLRFGLRGLVVIALVFSLVGSSPRTVLAAGLVVQTLSASLSASDLAQTLAGPGVTISNVTYTGTNTSAGKFTGGTTIIGFPEGVILSSGCAPNVVGPNVQDGITCSNGTAGDAQLTALSGVSTFDATLLEFDLVPVTPTLTFSYVFASDEYNEFSNSSFNDVFAFFVNGTNCALVPGTTQAVSINTINGGNPYGTNPKNPALFRNNDLSDGGGSIDTEMDGLTVVLTCTATVSANQTNHIKLAIADGSDTILDSDVFLQAHSFVADATKPSCVLTAVIPGPPKQLQITVQDSGSGLASIVGSTAVNATINIPPFTTGTTSAVVVVATKINESQGAQVGLTVTDVAGNVTVCDPVLTALVRDAGKPDVQTYTGVPQNESQILVMNGNPGVKKLEAWVNGTKFKSVDLSDNQTTTIDVGRAMRAGNTNTIELRAIGAKGSSVTVVIHD